jgi:hypothetical protein
MQVDLDAYRSQLKQETVERLKFLLDQVGRNGDSDWSIACEQAIKDELATRKQAGVTTGGGADVMYHPV